jgi:hypothetical protein
MVYCAAMMKEDGPKGAKAGYLVVEITAFYLKNLEEVFKFPTYALPLTQGVFRDDGAVFLPQAALESVGMRSVELLGSIADLRVVPELPGELKRVVEQERGRRAYQCAVVALAPTHGRKLFFWRAVPSGYGGSTRYRSETAWLDRGAVNSLSEVISGLLGRIG